MSHVLCDKHLKKVIEKQSCAGPHLHCDVSGMDINGDESSTGGSLQAGQLPTHQAHNLVQLCRAFVTVLGQAFEALLRYGLTNLLGPVHL